MVSVTRVCAVATLVVLSGCGAPLVWVNRGAAPVPTSGYLAGWFDTTNAQHETFAFFVEDATGREQVFNFVHPDRTGILQRDTTLGLVEVPPGEYRITSWAGPKRKPIAQSHPLGRSFTVRPGEVVFLGHFSGTLRSWP